MSIEKFPNINKDKQPPEDKDKSHKERIDLGRRKFIKRAGKLAAGAAALGVGGGAIKLIEKRMEGREKESWLYEWQELEELDKKEKAKEAGEKVEVKIENIADYYLDAYYRVSFKEDKFPPQVFEKDLLIAQQCQESRGRIDAKSHSGALGVMQNMTASIIDVTRYLNKLERNTGFAWEGPDKLSKRDIVEIKQLITQKSDYGRAFGKLYLMQLWDDKYGYGVGRAKYEQGDIKGAQVEILAGYNAGHSRAKGKSFDELEKLRDKYKRDKSKEGQREYRAYKEAADYVLRIFNYKKRLANIRQAMDEARVQFDGNEDYAAREIALKLDEVSGVSGEDRKRKLSEESKKYLLAFKKINQEAGRGPSCREISEIVQAKR